MTSISVIVPCYNVESYIEEGLRSVLQQTYSAREIICVDDGSQDKTITIIRKLQDEFPNKIFLYLNEKNRGATYTRNRGLAISRGD
jgi:glycosyltransferase involved in cell wall biosynthesis